ncbi:MAG: tRNA ((37)-C2)-methylthiotransferase MiaB [Bacteroidota bacterium]
MLKESTELHDESMQGTATLVKATQPSGGKKLYLESYGCAMNFSDSEVIASLLQSEGFATTDNIKEAEVILLNTCAIRDNAENRIWARLKDFKQQKRKNPSLVIGLLGCMAERLKTKVLEQEKLVDIVAGPDAYRDLPKLIKSAEAGQKAINVLLSREETYADINPVRLATNGISAFVSIMRGCDNMCSFCVVPFTRGRERSRDFDSILREVQQLADEGYKEITLLGQNVDSYLWSGGGQKKDLPEGMANAALAHLLPPDEQIKFKTFADLLEACALVNPELRIRFSTSNPRDITTAVIQVMAKYENICKSIHLPVQSGSTTMLERMNRGYTREQYLNWVENIKTLMPDCGITTDIIAGFSGETEAEHLDTISMIEIVGYDFAYMYKYSERPGTAAAKKMPDDVSGEIKSSRLTEIVAVKQRMSHASNLKDIGKEYKVLIDGYSKKDAAKLKGRNSQNKVIIFEHPVKKPGDYAIIRITDCTSATLFGEVVS